MGEHIGAGDRPGCLLEGTLMIAFCYFSTPALVPAAVKNTFVKAHGVDVLQFMKWQEFRNCCTNLLAS